AKEHWADLTHLRSGVQRPWPNASDDNARLLEQMAVRTKVSSKTASEVMDLVDLRCCMCPAERGLPPMVRNGQIHHLDGVPTNGAIGNLVYLCLYCHEEAAKRGRAARSWSSNLISRRRDR